MFLYSACFSFCFLSFLVFWTMIYTTDPFTADTKHSERVCVLMMNTVPPIILLLEYPFNMIPINIRQLPIDLIIYLLWGFVSLIYEFTTKIPVFGPMSWIQTPWKAIGIYFSGFIFEIIIFFLLYWFTEQIKLPFYRRKIE